MKEHVRSAFGGQLPVRVVVEPKVNEDSPVAVDMVVVYDQKVLDELLNLPASQWFEGKPQFVADHHRKIAVPVQGWEWVPGQHVGKILIEYRAGARAVVVFADYHSAGAHRLVVSPQHPFQLVLKERGLVKEKMR